MEVGMTTAERRRRRRRGGGLRVPSDNVPRTRPPTTPPVPAPVPEDPSLAMSIAYSFSGDASAAGARSVHDPIAPDAMATLIDPPSGPIDTPQDFETKTREMSAVDLEALGLADPATTLRMDRISSPQIENGSKEISIKRESEPSIEVDVDDAVDSPAPPTKLKPAARPDGEKTTTRLATVALSEDDLEEVRAQTQPAAANRKPTTKPPPLGVPRQAESNKTQPLSVLDVEMLKNEDPISVSELDIQELAERAAESGEIEVDVDEKPAAAARGTPPPAPPAEARKPDAPAPPAPPAAAQGTPPPPPKAPPAPPPKKVPPPAAVAAVVAKEPSRPTSARQRSWFADLFDEDYLRTLPFLTPQATQAEAEFAIEAMGLAPGAQVLDVGCGYGRHAMELAARGFHVVGLDLSTPLLVRGGEEAHRRGLTINFIRGDMRELDFDGQFDGAYCLFSTFGYFDDETNKKALQNISHALKVGGKVLIEILNRDYVIADLPTRVWWEGDGCVVLEEVELNYFSSRIQVNRSVVFDDGRQLEQEISVRAYSLHEIGKLMHAAGFRVLEVSGGYQTRGRFFGNQSRHIIVLAERKETSGT
jgi:SAM-dependent methyltransferase